MNPALHHDALTLPPAHSHLKLLPPRASAHGPYSHYGQPPGPHSIARSNHDPPDHFEVSPSKRQRLTASEPAGVITTASLHHQPPSGMEPRLPIGFDVAPRGSEYPRSGLPRRESIERRASTPTPILAAPVASKSRRVRTGCLTCRERHLKCDEGLPECNNCRKSNRECKRGVRLNFIDVQVKNPPYMPPTPLDWSVQFEDESRLIASEYRGGLGKYPRLDAKAITPPREPEPQTTVRHPSVSSREPTAGPREGYYGGTASMAPTPGPTGYDDNQPAPLSGLPSRKDSGPMPAAQTPASQAGPSPVIGPASGSFSLNMLNEQNARDDGAPRNRVYRGSDASSVASSLVPQGAGPGSQNLRPSALGPMGQPGGTPDGLMTPPSERAAGERDYLSDEEEIRFMQVFIDDVAIWMDTLDKEKHFTNVTPYLALKSAMMLNAFLACGAKHLNLIEAYNDEKALFYYDTATTQLLRSLQNPDRDMTECAATAVVLNVYEIMSEKPTQRMNHIAGARALIRECGWNATTPGIGGACFWLNIGMEVLSCLHFNWQIAWDPDQWGLDLSFTNLTPSTASEVNSQRGGGGLDAVHIVTGDEETWAHRMFYIVAKIVNFRASIPRFQEPSPHDEQMRLQSRFAEWKRLKALCDAWNHNCPRSMQSYGYSHSPSTKSLFPNIWLIKRPAVIGRLFYHTAMCVLAQINPLNPHDSKENRAAQLHHAHQVCGIVAHTRDRGVASVAIRSLATSSSVLTDRHEQTEVLNILDKISKETGWRLGRIFAQLKKDWGWESQGMPFSTGGNGSQLQYHPGPQHHQQQMSPFPVTTTSLSSTIMAATTSSSSSSTTTISAPTPMRPLINPLLVNADFGNRNHPYKNWYEPPNRSSNVEFSSRSVSRNGGNCNGGGGGGGLSSGLLSWASTTGSA